MEWATQTGFNTADWIIVAVVVLSTLISLSRGFVREALSLLTWAAAFVVAFLFSDKLAPLLSNVLDLPSLRYIAAFALLFVLTLIVGSLMNYIITQLVRMTGLSAIDRLLGSLFGVCRGVLIALLVLMFLPKVLPPVQQDSWWQQSRLIPRILVLEGWASETASSVKGWSGTQLEQQKASVDKSNFVERVQKNRGLHHDEAQQQTE